eukprot:COSAG06_NODE_392_length_16344_cov_4.086981_6_plen_132_part_00
MALRVAAVLLQLPLGAFACDAGVFWGRGCSMDPVSGAPDPACSTFPFQANATSSSTTLIWEEGGKGYGGLDDLGGDVFLSTTLNMGCGGGYYGRHDSQPSVPASRILTGPPHRIMLGTAWQAPRCIGTPRR